MIKYRFYSQQQNHRATLGSWRANSRLGEQLLVVSEQVHPRAIKFDSQREKTETMEQNFNLVTGIEQLFISLSKFTLRWSNFLSQ